MDPAPVADRPDPATADATATLPRPEPAPATVASAPAPVPPVAAPSAAVTVDAADLAAIEGLRRRHAATTAPTPSGATDADVAPDDDAARCPIPGVGALGLDACPVLRSPGDVHRTRADLVVRRLLRIPDETVDLNDANTYRVFQRSMGISAVRCTLTYVVFPFVLPALNFAKGYGPWIGFVIGSIALVCDTFAIRRFFAVDHKYRWHFSAIAFAIMCLLTVLLVQDISHIVSSFRS
jgi:hypothetical protein